MCALVTGVQTCALPICIVVDQDQVLERAEFFLDLGQHLAGLGFGRAFECDAHPASGPLQHEADRSEEHTSELQSLMRISYAVFCLIKKNELTELALGQIETARKSTRRNSIHSCTQI